MRLFRSKPRLGALLLGSWLIATGILHLVPRISFSGSGEILAGLAIAAGVLLVLDRQGRAGNASDPRDRPGAAPSAGGPVLRGRESFS